MKIEEIKALISKAPKTKMKPGCDYVLVSKTKGEPKATDIKVMTADKFRTEKRTMYLIGGFHTICANVGEIPGHPLSGLMAGDILPLSIWNEHHRAACPQNDGMVYDPIKDIWVDIYLAAGTGMDTKSAYGGKISNSRKYEDFEADAKSVGKRLMTHYEFSSIAEGSNELSRIDGKKFPGKTGGHIDQVGRRMVSNIGCEDCCGVLCQWLSTPDLDYPDEWRLLAGGHWSRSTYAGSRCRDADSYRWITGSSVGARFASEPLNRRT